MKHRIMCIVFSVPAGTPVIAQMKTVVLVTRYPEKDALWLTLTERALEWLSNEGCHIPDNLNVTIQFSDNTARAAEQIRILAPDVVFANTSQPEVTTCLHDISIPVMTYDEVIP